MIEQRTHQPGREERSAEWLVLTVIVIWALNGPFTKFGLRGLDVFVFNSIRYVLAFLMLAGFFVARWRWVPIQSGDWFNLVRLGLLANVVYQLLFIIGLSMTTAGNSAVLLSTSPLWTALLNAKLHKERVPPQAWFGMAISLAGVVMIIIGSGKKLEFGSNALFGDMLSLAAAFVWALSTNLQKPLLARYSSMQLTLVSVGTGAIVLSLVGVPSVVAVHWSSVETIYWIVPVISGLASIGVANVLWSYGVKYIGPRRTGNYGNLLPVIAFIAAYVALDEQVFLIQWIGAAVTIVGVWIARR
jgi:drug/metabolite transporter (DMT)-like permease